MMLVYLLEKSPHIHTLLGILDHLLSIPFLPFSYHILQGNQRNTNIITSVLQYNKTKNEPIETLPLFNGQIMDLALLFMRITERGAYREESKYKFRHSP